MARNPNPARVSDALWYFAESCIALAPGSENGGTFADKPGYHNTRNNLYNQGRTNDYSVRLAADKLGPGDKTAAFDWTFPNAQRGEYATIIRFGDRVEFAFHARDPRLRGWREVLIQADPDEYAEGFDFTSWTQRTPDSSHLWHAHFSVLRQYVNDMDVMNGMLSILSGEPLSTWTSGQSRYGGTEEDMNDDQNRRLFNVDEGYFASVIDMQDNAVIVPWGGTPDNKSSRKVVPNKLAQTLKGMQTDLAAVKAAVGKPATQVDVDAAAVAAALAADESFRDALATDVANKLAARLKD